MEEKKWLFLFFGGGVCVEMVGVFFFKDFFRAAFSYPGFSGARSKTEGR